MGGWSEPPALGRDVEVNQAVPLAPRGILPDLGPLAPSAHCHSANPLKGRPPGPGPGRHGACHIPAIAHAPQSKLQGDPRAARAALAMDFNIILPQEVTD